jgi:subtilase family serine protease
MFAGIVALAGQAAGHPLGLINPALYTMSARHDPGIVNVTRGGNTVSFRQHGGWHTVHGFHAAPGYNLAVGVGTIYAPDFVPELARLAGQAARHSGIGHSGSGGAGGGQASAGRTRSAQLARWWIAKEIWALLR